MNRKTLALALSLMLSLSTGALFAQTETDTSQKQDPQTDTIPKKDTTKATSFAIANSNLRSTADALPKENPKLDSIPKKDTSNASFVNANLNLKSITENSTAWNGEMKGQTVYATFPIEEYNAITTSSK